MKHTHIISILYRAGEQDKISIIQLAVTNNVYIVDLFKLYGMPNSEDVLKEFFTLFFTSRHIIKIGYGIIGDLKILIGMFGYMTELVKNSWRSDSTDNESSVSSTIFAPSKKYCTDGERLVIIG